MFSSNEIPFVEYAIRLYQYRVKRFVVAGGLDLPPLCSKCGLDPNCKAIVHDTDHSFDQEPVQQLRPNVCHVSLPLQSALCLLLVSISPSSH
jgi:hypothetical protein